MSRAELRRQAREAKKKKAVYNLTEEQIEDIKHKATEEAIDTAFILMLGLPVMVLHDKFSLIRKKENRLENFTEAVLELYEAYNEDYLTLEDIKQVLKDEAGYEFKKERVNG